MIRIGSRGSLLALWQANFIADSLRRLGQEVSIEIIRTTGDRMQEIAFPAADGKGIFTKEIEDALEKERIDLAVHSLKDLPTELAPQFVLGAIPKRADARDVFVSQRFSSIEQLPEGAVVGTGSLRRQAQLRSLRPDLAFIEFRGNVDTRLRKLGEGKADAIILAAAGLDRLEKTDWVRQRFATDVLCPAPGQGALAIECRAEDQATLAIIGSLEDTGTRAAVTAERRFLAALGGGCQLPVGAYAHPVAGEVLSLRGVIAAPDGSAVVAGELQELDPGILGDKLAKQLLDEGAGQILSIKPIGSAEGTV